jgi:outer membrane lipoprotein SlyB
MLSEQNQELTLENKISSQLRKERDVQYPTFVIVRPVHVSSCRFAPNGRLVYVAIGG